MKLQIVAVGNKMPAWVQAGFAVYASRFPREMPLTLVEIPAEKRGKNTDPRRLIEKEGEAILAAIGKGNLIIALDIPGQAWNTRELSYQLSHWRREARDISLLIGGPEGLSPHCKAAANSCWSLSPLTLPHPIVRILVAESLYRAWTLIINHPYHRE